MSIENEIADRVQRKMLFPLLPRAPGSPVRRALFVAEDLWSILTSDIGDPEWERRVGQLQADLEVFVEGRVIDPKYLFLLYPCAKGVWEIRSVRDQPSIRVLGLFAKRDVFIATNAALREDLGGWQSREWKEVKRRAQAQWRWLFPSYQPVVSSHVQDVATGALNGRYFKE
jgi:hypothetical protein